MFDFMSPALAALLQVILIDIVLAGDNALLIGIVAARVPRAERKRVIFWALVLAVIARIALAYFTVNILNLIGLRLAGGLLLLWVAWRLYREIRHQEHKNIDLRRAKQPDDNQEEAPGAALGIRSAIIQVAIADISMSLDNVLAVAGAAINHVWVLGIGLLFSIALMGVAAAMIASLLQRHPWVSYAGLIIIIYVAFRMIVYGGAEISEQLSSATRSNAAVTWAMPSHGCCSPASA